MGAVRRGCLRKPRHSRHEDGKEALLYKEASKDSPGGIEQRCWVVSSKGSGPVLDSYETAAPSARCDYRSTGNGAEDQPRVPRRNGALVLLHSDRQKRAALQRSRRDGGCDHGSDRHLAMAHKKRIEFKPEWFDPTSDAAPETDPDVVG